MIITKENMLKTSNIVVSNEDLLYPIANLIDPWLSVKYKSILTLAAVYITEPLDIDVICFAGHNFDNTLVIEYYEDIDFTIKLGEENIAIEQTIIHELLLKNKYLKIIITNNNLIEIGYMKASKIIEAVTLADSSTISLQLFDNIDTSSLGQNNAQERISSESISLSFWLNEMTYIEYLSLFKINRQIYPIFIWQYPAGTFYNNKLCVLFDNERIQAKRKIYGKNYAYYNFETTFKEAK